MKPSALFAFLSFLLFAFTTTTTAMDVIDTDGDLVRNGGRYYLDPPAIGGITIAAITDANFTSCALAVVNGWVNGGREITLSHLIKIPYIRTNTLLLLEFADLPSNLCSSNSYWVVRRSDSFGKIVMVGGAQEFSDAIVRGSFRLQFFDVLEGKHFYKLVFCEGEDCKNISFHYDVFGTGLRRLVVTDHEPMIFQIRKAQRSFDSGLSKLV